PHARLPGTRAVSVADARRQRGVGAGISKRSQEARPRGGPPVAGPRQPGRLRTLFSASGVGWHAATRRVGPRLHRATPDDADGRALRRARRVDAPEPARRTAPIDRP